MVRKATLQWKRCLAAVAKQNGGPILLSTFSANQLTDDYCDVLVQPLANIVLRRVTLFHLYHG